VIYVGTFGTDVASMYGRITVTTNKNATYIFSEGNEKC